MYLFLLTARIARTLRRCPASSRWSEYIYNHDRPLVLVKLTSLLDAVAIAPPIYCRMRTLSWPRQTQTNLQPLTDGNVATNCCGLYRHDQIIVSKKSITIDLIDYVVYGIIISHASTFILPWIIFYQSYYVVPLAIDSLSMHIIYDSTTSYTLDQAKINFTVREVYIRLKIAIIVAYAFKTKFFLLNKPSAPNPQMAHLH